MVVLAKLGLTHAGACLEGDARLNGAAFLVLA
jgi:hypothetical protein